MMGIGAEAVIRSFGDLICWGTVLTRLAKELPYFRFYQFQKWAFQTSSSSQTSPTQEAET